MAIVVNAAVQALTSIGLGAATAQAVVQFGGGLLLNAAANAIFRPSAGRIRQAEIRRSLQFPTSRPPYRFAYGDFRMPGTVLPYPVVGRIAYAAYLISSRPSEGPFALYLDNREVAFTGDPFDLTGPGAAATEAPFLNHVNFWIGRGDQTAPPQVFTDEAGWAPGLSELLWRTTDAGQGLTVLWVRMDAGSNETRLERWPNATPQAMLEGKFSKVYDPRNGTQDIADPSTWAYSDNQALCLMDALTQNPFRPYELANLDLATWRAAADVADELVDVLSAPQEKRYRCAGFIMFDGGEIEDIVEPLVVAGASKLSRQGALLGIIPGAPRTPVVEIADSLSGIGFQTLKTDRQLPTQVRATYASAARGNEAAELPAWDIPGALAADGGKPKIISLDLSMVSSATQAQRVRNITGRLARQQQSLTLTAPPSAMKAVPGSVVNVNLPAPLSELMSGRYEVQSMHPAADPVGEDALAMRVPMVLLSYTDDVFAWDPATDQQVIDDPVYDGDRAGVAPPGAISVITGNTVNRSTGDQIIPRVRFAFAPSPSASVSRYEWQFRAAGDDYGASAFIDADLRDGNGDVFGFMEGEAGVSHDIRVRTISAGGASDFVEFIEATPTVDVTLNPPYNGSATAGTGEITATWTSSNDADMTSVEVWASDTDDVNAAAMLGTAINVAQNTMFSVTESGLTTGQTRYYFARSRGSFDSASAFTASETATAL